MGKELGPTRPDRLTIWPVEGDGFGIDVRWGGAAGNRRATVVARLLQDAGIRGRLTQGLDGAWEVRVGPVPGSDVARVIDEFVWGFAARPTTAHAWDNRLMITKLDLVGVPSQDAERSVRFYGETLGLKRDEHGGPEFWVGETCIGIWEPARFGMEFAPQKNAHLALHVDDVAAAREQLESKGVTFGGDILDTGVCHMAFFTDPDGNDLMLHHRYAPYE